MERGIAATGAAGWALVFLWLWVGTPPAARILGALWAVLGIAAPTGYLISLVLAFPWFGNNPGGEHLLYLLDMGLMGFVAGHLARRAAGRTPRRRSPLDPWIALLVCSAWIGLAPQARWIGCELLTERLGFMHRIYTHYANAYCFGLRMALDLTLAAGLFGALRDRPWPPLGAQRGSALLVLAAAATAAAGLLHFAGWLPLDWWRGENPESWRWGVRRLQSLYYHPGWLAEYLTLVAPSALALAWATRRRGLRAGWAVVWALLAIATLLTMARAGWLALVAGSGVAALALAAAQTPDARARWRRGLTVVGALAAALGVLAAAAAWWTPDLARRALELAAYRHRTDIWQRAWQLIGMAPLSGIGLGDYAHYYSMLHYDDEFGRTWITAHNLYWHLWAERGLIGLGLFAGLVTTWARGLVRTLAAEAPRARTGDADVRRRQALRAAVLGALAAFLVDGIFQYNFYVRAIEVLFWLTMGVSAPLMPEPASTGRWARRGLLPAIVLMAIAMAVENGHRFRPWRIGVGGIDFRIGGARVEVPIPPGARRVALTVASFDPNLARYPIDYEARWEGQTLARATFDATGTRTLTLELPAPAPPGARIELSVSRTWSPWAYGLRAGYPVLELGVMYTDPVVLDDAAKESQSAGIHGGDPVRRSQCVALGFLQRLAYELDQDPPLLIERPNKAAAEHHGVFGGDSLKGAGVFAFHRVQVWQVHFFVNHGQQPAASRGIQLADAVEQTLDGRPVAVVIR